MLGAPGLQPTPPSAADALPRQLVPARIHALRPGTWPGDPVDLTITADDVVAIAAAYDPQRHQAPVVIGHPETDDPAWGWLTGAVAIDGQLWLDTELLPEMADLVRERRYQFVSLSLYPPGAPGNPTPETFGIKHLGFLGAQPPAVKGLTPVRINAAAAAGAVAITLHSLEAPVNTATNPAAAPATAPATDPAATVNLAERQAQLDARERELAAREAAHRRRGYEAEADVHVRAARITAADRPAVIALMERLDAAPVVNLSETTTEPAIETFRKLLGSLPARVQLGEIAGGAVAATSAPAPAVPHGYRLSERGMSLHARAIAHQASHPGCDYITAVRAVERAQ